MRARGYLLILCAAVLWGLIGPISKFIFAEGVGALEAAFWRSLIGFCLFAVHTLVAGGGRARPADLPAMIVFGIVGVGLFYGAYLQSIGMVGAALASVLLYTAPAWVALLSRLLLGEPLTSGKLGAVAATMAGVACVSFSGGGGATLSGTGILLGLASGLIYACYYIVGKKYLQRYDTRTLFLYALPVGALCLLPFVDFQPKTSAAWAFLLLLSATTTYGAYTVYYAGLKHLDATRAAVVATLEPVVSAALAWWWWNERFGPLGYVGSVLILSAVLVMVATDARRAPAGTSR